MNTDYQKHVDLIKRHTKLAHALANRSIRHVSSATKDATPHAKEAAATVGSTVKKYGPKIIKHAAHILTLGAFKRPVHGKTSQNHKEFRAQLDKERDDKINAHKAKQAEMKKEREDSPNKHLTQDYKDQHAAALKKTRDEFDRKQAERDKNRVKYTAANSNNVKKIAEALMFEAFTKKLTREDKVEVWIKHFQTSTSPRFKGKSQEERKKQAIAAHFKAINKRKF